MYNLEFELTQQLPAAWSRVVLVSAPSGARSDMVIGWISSLKMSLHPVRWSIWPSGKNDIIKNWMLLFGGIDIHSTAQLESAGSQLLDFVSEHIDSTAPALLAKSHMSVAILQKIFSDQLWKHFFVINVIPQDPESIATAQWENFVKTYTRSANIDERFWSYFIPNQCEIAQPGFLSLNDREKLLHGDPDLQFRCIELMYNTYIAGNLPNRQYAQPDALDKPGVYSVLDYKTVMTDQGCHTIGDLLGVELTPLDIERWQRTLQATRSPDFIDFVGHRWHRPKQA
jgi:hypothetical protein